MELRPATADDRDFLWLMLTYAASMSPGGEASLAAARADPELRFYVDGFPGPGEHGVIAQDDAGRPIGAAWLRLSPGHPVPLPHKVATDTEPELAIAVSPSARGGGVGLAMLAVLLAEADRRFPATVLTVRPTNPSARLYERVGYAHAGEIVNRVGTRSLCMRRVTPGR